MPKKRFTTSKRRLTPLQGELLGELREAGAENLRCLVITLQPEDLDEFEDDVKQLIHAGLVALYRNLRRPGLRYAALLKEEVENLPPFHEILRQEFDPMVFEGIMLTPAGKAALIE